MICCELYKFWTRPWEECVMCCLGPTFLNSGEDIRIGFGFFFFEIGMRFWNDPEMDIKL